MKHYITENDIGQDGYIHFNRIRERMAVADIERAGAAQGIQFYILEDYQYERVRNEGMVDSTEFGIFLHGEAVASYFENKISEKEAQVAKRDAKIRELEAQLAALNGLSSKDAAGDKGDKRRKRSSSSDYETADIGLTENIDTNE